MVIVSTFLAIVEFHDSNVASEMDNFSQPLQENARIILQSRSRAFPFTSFSRHSPGIIWIFDPTCSWMWCH